MNPDSQSDENGRSNTGGSEELKPGDTVSMRSDGTPNPAPSQPVAAEQHFFRPETANTSTPSPSPSSGSAVDTTAPAPQTPSPAVISTPPSPVAPSYQVPEPLELRMQDDSDGVSWTASEFIAHEKSSGWYLRFSGVALLVTALVVVITRDIFSTIIIIIVSAIFGYAASRKPRQMQYMVDGHGISIGRRFYPYKDFRGFSLMPDGPFQSITFMPLKRFMPPMNIYFDPTDEERIVNVLAAHLPLEARSRDAIDRLMRHIRF